mgnify:FL=1
MGYRRSFTETISVHYSGSVSYPASQSGGSVSYSGTAYETVNVNIYVDTDPFDNSVDRCNGSVRGLTTAVAAMNAAQVKSIAENAERVGNTITEGFFTTVRSEISSQIATLRSNVDAILLHLNELAKQCADKQRQMQTDYARLTSRYMKIFDELDSECRTRILELDRPAFLFKRMADEGTERSMCSDLVTTAAVAGGENSQIEARIGASYTKRTAMEAIGRANAFLALQRKTENVIAKSTFNESVYGMYYAPVCYIETTDNQKIDRKAFSAESIAQINNAKLVEQIRNVDFGKCDDEERHLQNGFNQVVSTHYANANEHDARVRDYVTKLFKSNINR